jgi:hypothetical protein
VREYLIESIGRHLDMAWTRCASIRPGHDRDDLLSTSMPEGALAGPVRVRRELCRGTGWGVLFGDDNAPSQIRPWWYTRLTQDPRNPNAGGDSGFSVLDFGLFSTFRDNVSRGSFGGIGGVLSRDWVYGE